MAAVYRCLGRLGTVALLLLVATAATAVPPSDAFLGSRSAGVIVLPGATSAEGITAGRGTTFYAGDYLAGDIYRGDVRTGTAERFIDVPSGRQALGLKTSNRFPLLFVAGGSTGQAYVYDLRRRTTVAVYRFGPANASFINDVVLTRDGAWFTDSFRARLYFVPTDRRGAPGRRFRALTVRGPAAAITGKYNLNGIQAAPGGHTLVVSHSHKGALYTVDATSGDSKAVAGVSVPMVDGIVLHGHTVWAVQNYRNQIQRITLNDTFSHGVTKKTITSGLFRVPTAAARFGHTLAVVNGKLHPHHPPTAKVYEVVVVNA
ncbi:hypothetical protein ADK86_24350 [Streptomyces sp. NRRL F-5755]|nr:hypothetical protein ADK86_24350 [Streptomyces sp. NRRL F-5755]